MTVLRICFCPERIGEMNANTFRWSHDLGGWFFTDAPARSMSLRTRFYVRYERGDQDHPDHAGEPYIHRDCPWCGNVLPGCLDLEPPTQAGGIL